MYFGHLGMSFGCPNSYLGVWTCIFGVWTCIFGVLNLYINTCPRAFGCPQGSPWWDRGLLINRKPFPTLHTFHTLQYPTPPHPPPPRTPPAPPHGVNRLVGWGAASWIGSHCIFRLFYDFTWFYVILSHLVWFYRQCLRFNFRSYLASTITIQSEHYDGSEHC